MLTKTNDLQEILRRCLNFFIHYRNIKFEGDDKEIENQVENDIKFCLFDVPNIFEVGTLLQKE